MSCYNRNQWLKLLWMSCGKTLNIKWSIELKREGYDLYFLKLHTLWKFWYIFLCLKSDCKWNEGLLGSLIILWNGLELSFLLQLDCLISLPSYADVQCAVSLMFQELEKLSNSSLPPFTAILPPLRMTSPPFKMLLPHMEVIIMTLRSKI